MSTPTPRGTIASWIDGLPAQGRSTFNATDVMSEVGGTDAARKLALNRLVGRQLLFQPHHGFFVVVPPEYRQIGAPPPLWYIDALMGFLGLRYYVGLLSAAALHGAADQAPQEFQVCTSRPIRRMVRGPSYIRWFVKKSVATTPLHEKRTPNGYVLVSSPAATALDLVQYVRQAGQLSNVATVLHELDESITSDDMTAALVTCHAPAIAQRLGYLLSWSRTAQSPATGALERWLSKTPRKSVSLQPGAPTAHAPVDAQWRVFVNATIEPDGDS